MTNSLTHGLIERSIVRFAVRSLLEQGFALSVQNDAFGSGPITLADSRDYDAIVAVCFDTDDLLLEWAREPLESIGFVAFIFGNGIDCIHTWSGDLASNDAVQPTLEFVRALDETPEAFAVVPLAREMIPEERNALAGRALLHPTTARMGDTQA